MLAIAAGLCLLSIFVWLIGFFWMMGTHSLPEDQPYKNIRRSAGLLYYPGIALILILLAKELL